MDRIKVLVAGSANITGLNIIRSLKDYADLVGYDMSNINAADMFCRNHVFPRTTDPDYLKRVCDLIDSEKIFAIIPSNDHDARALLNMKGDLIERGVHLNADYPYALHCLDKRKTSEIFNDHSIPTPEILKRDSKLPFVVRKETVGGSKKFTYIVKNEDDKSSISENDWASAVITRYHPGEEYTIDVVSDSNSRVMSIVPRLRREVRAGMVHFAEVVNNQDVIAETKKIVSSLKLTGINCMQCIYDDNGCHFFEINPRPGSGMDLSTNAGVNMPQMWLRSIMGERVEYLEPDWGMKLVRYFDGYFFK